jgi:cytochrome c oxidase cbb3-type subunit 3
MTMFTSEFWNIWVIGVTIVSILGTAWLLWSTNRIKVKNPAGTPSGQVSVTGHVWDDDLEEYNNPLPKWWSNLFWITIVFAIVYLVLYPGLGSFQGVLGWSSSGAYEQERKTFDARLAPLYAKYASMDIEAIARDPAARETGERLFLTYCSQCHGSDAGGARGFPSLRDNDWLFGGAPDTIVLSLTKGRMGVMPAFGAVLGPEGVRDVAAYVRSLSGLPHDSLRAQVGKPLFAQNCAACHGGDGKGLQAVGAPNLTDGIWLYNSSEATIIEGITKGRHVDPAAGLNAMPAFENQLTAPQIRVVAAYVWSLSNKAPAK